MLSNIARSVTFWALSASYSPRIQGEHHALCRTLDNREHQHPTQFPSVYTCYGDKEDAVCTSRGVETTGASAEKEALEDVIWWVYRGRREIVSGRADDLCADEWVYCAEYYARRRPVLGPSNIADASPSRRPHELSLKTTNGVSTEPRLSAGTSRNVPISRKTRTVPREDPHGFAGVEIAATRIGGEENARADSDNHRTDLVYAPNAVCDDEFWLSWPAIQDRAISHGTVVVFDVFASVGNLFLTLNILMKFVRFLELGLILRWTEFPGFREAFNPGEINWSVDCGPFMQQIHSMKEGAKATGFHAMEFRNFAMILSDSQLELLALTIDIDKTSTAALANFFRNEIPGSMSAFMGAWMREPLGLKEALAIQPCTWNMLLRRSPSMIASLKEYSPWGVLNSASGRHHQTTEYIAWHIRTADGETVKSYNPTVHKYVIQEPSSDVCAAYLVAMQDALKRTKSCHASLSVQADNDLVYISSNSKPMAEDCTVEAANHDIAMGHVDMGLNSTDAHTAYSQTPLKTALSTFLDFFFLLDSTVIVRTGSSFSGTAAKIKGLRCRRQIYEALPKRALFICLPSDC